MGARALGRYSTTRDVGHGGGEMRERRRMLVKESQGISCGCRSTSPAPRGRRTLSRRRRPNPLLGRHGAAKEVDCDRGENRARGRPLVRESQGGLCGFRPTSPAPRGSASIEPAVPRHGIDPSRAADGARRARSPDELAKYPPCCVRGFGSPSLSVGGRVLVGEQVMSTSGGGGTESR